MVPASDSPADIEAAERKFSFDVSFLKIFDKIQMSIHYCQQICIQILYYLIDQNSYLEYLF